MKILFVIWLLSPATRGSSVLYRRFVHPQLTKREKVSIRSQIFVSVINLKWNEKLFFTIKSENTAENISVQNYQNLEKI